MRKMTVLILGKKHALENKVRRSLSFFHMTSRLFTLIATTVLLAACQPPNPADLRGAADNDTQSPIIVREDTVTMAPEYIMAIKPTRYQPSLGLQGQLESIKNAQLSVNDGQEVASDAPLLNISDDTDLHFVATLPTQAESQLSVGQNVTFTTEGLKDVFVGQVSNLSINTPTNTLLVSVNVVKNDASRGKLRPQMKVTGRVDYGQIEVGTTIPEHGIHDADLSELQKPPYQPISTLTANVWIIKQDQRLTRQSIEVISYDPSTRQYLIAGLNNDSLVCLADLSLESAGKKVVVS